MVIFFANTFKSSYYKHLMGSSTQQFYYNVRIAERIEQAIKIGKNRGPTMGSRTMMRDESKHGS
jgi:hypothetical protein